MKRPDPSSRHRVYQLLAVAVAWGTTIRSASAAPISYGWTYSLRDVELAHGTLDAQGVDSMGFLEQIFNFRFAVRTTSDGWTPSLVADCVSGWFSPIPRIPANGTTANIDLNLTAENGGMPAAFLLFQYPGFGGPYHSDVVYTDADFNVHSRMAESLSALEWSLWQISPGGTAVPDGGSTLALLAAPIAACILAFRQARKHRANPVG